MVLAACMEAYVSRADLFHKIFLTLTTPVMEITKLSRSFSKVLLNKARIPLPLPPILCVSQQKGAYVQVKVNQVAFQGCLNLCKYSLIGRIILEKGNKPYPLAALRSKLSAI